MNKPEYWKNREFKKHWVGVGDTGCYFEIPTDMTPEELKWFKNRLETAGESMRKAMFDEEYYLKCLKDEENSR